LLLWTTLIVVAGTLAIPFLRPLSSIFGFVPLSALQMSTLIAIVIGYIANGRSQDLVLQMNVNPEATIAVQMTIAGDDLAWRTAVRTSLSGGNLVAAANNWMNGFRKTEPRTRTSALRQKRPVVDRMITMSPLLSEADIVRHISHVPKVPISEIAHRNGSSKPHSNRYAECAASARRASHVIVGARHAAYATLTDKGPGILQCNRMCSFDRRALDTY
jgi:hypothetical protein